jgi:TonB dependent receptor/Carboxypeptidase regulatory-like domain
VPADAEAPARRPVRTVARRRVLAATVFLALGAAPADAGAQAQGATIRGQVADETGAGIPAAEVRAEGTQVIGGPRHAQTDRSGYYTLIDLPPGAYMVSANKAGFAPASVAGVVVAAGGGHVVDLMLRVGGIKHTVAVEASAASVDVTDPAVPQNVTAAQLKELPTSRLVPDLINLVPGVAGGVAFGGTQASNALAIDGVDLTDTTSTSPHLIVNQNWLQEVHITSLGAGAAHDGSTGVYADAIVRSGANTWSGLGEFWTVPRSWVASNTGSLSEELQRDFAPRDVIEHWDVEGQAGGPLWADRVWVFGGAQRQRLWERPAGYDGPDVRRQDSAYFISKISAAPANALRAEGMLIAGRHTVERSDIGPLIRPEAAGDFEQRQTAWNARLSWAPRAALVAELRYGGFDSPLRYEPHPPGSCEGPPGRFDIVTGVNSVNVSECYHSPRNRHEIDATISLAATTGTVRHEIRGGVAHMRALGWNQSVFPGGALYLDADGEPFRVLLSPGNSSTARSSTSGGYLEDRMRLGARLTMVPGVRVDLSGIDTPEDPDAVRMAAVSPRVGAAYDVSSDHRTVIRAHWGRYHDPISVNAVRTMQTDLSDSPAVVEAIPVGPDQWEVVSERRMTSNVTIDSSLRQSRVDQWTIGAEHEVVRGVLIQAQYIGRRFDDFVGFVDTGSVWEPIERQDPGPDGLLETPDDGPVLTLFRKINPGNERLLYTNPPGARRGYDAAQVVARRAYASNWQMQASYTWSRAKGNVGNVVYTNAGFGDLASTFANPNRQINSWGRGPHDPTHEVKLLGTVRLPWWGGFSASGVYRYTTGYAWAREAAFPGVRLGTSLVRMEPNGARRVDAINNLDLRAEKTVPLGGRRMLALFVDALNVTNQGVPDSDDFSPVWPVSGPNLGVPTAWRPARSLRATVRVTF